MPADVAVGAPVVDHVVDVLHGALGLGIAALVVDPQIVRKGDVVALAEAAEALRIDPFADQAVLQRDVVGAGQSDAVPAAPLDRDVVEDHVAALAQSDRAFLVLLEREALPQADVPDDDVVRLGARDGVVLQADTLARRGLPGDGDIAGDAHGRGQVDVSADVEDHDPPFGGHRVAEGAGSAVVEIGDVVERAAAPAAGQRAEALGAGKRDQQGAGLRLRSVGRVAGRAERGEHRRNGAGDASRGHERY